MYLNFITHNFCFFRFLFYEDWEENYRMRKTYMEELERKFDEASESDSVSVDTNTSERYFSSLVFFY